MLPIRPPTTLVLIAVILGLASGCSTQTPNRSNHPQTQPGVMTTGSSMDPPSDEEAAQGEDPIDIRLGDEAQQDDPAQSAQARTERQPPEDTEAQRERVAAADAGSQAATPEPQSSDGGFNPAAFIASFFSSDEETEDESRDVGDGVAQRGEDDRVRRLEQEVARLEADLRGHDSESVRGTVGEGPGGPAIGVVFAGEDDLAAARALEAFSRVAGDYPISLVGPARIAEELDHQGCPIAQPAGCTRALAISPGIRLLAVVHSIGEDSDSDSDSDKDTIRVRLFDTDLEWSYPAQRFRLPTRDGRIPTQSLEYLADAVYLNALDRLRIAPPIYHVVARDDDAFYLNRGRNSGLTAGAELTIHDGGRVVRSGGGAPAAWIPAAPRGRLRVESFTGSGLAVARLLEGQPPEPASLLIPSQQ